MQEKGTLKYQSGGSAHDLFLIQESLKENIS